MMTFFCVMVRCLRMRPALEGTIYSPAFFALNLNKRVAHAVSDIKKVAVWKALYTDTNPVYPVICILRYCNSTVPCMDKLYFLAYRVAKGIKNLGRRSMTWISSTMKQLMTASLMWS